MFLVWSIEKKLNNKICHAFVIFNTIFNIPIFNIRFQARSTIHISVNIEFTSKGEDFNHVSPLKGKMEGNKCDIIINAMDLKMGCDNILWVWICRAFRHSQWPSNKVMRSKDSRVRYINKKSKRSIYIIIRPINRIIYYNLDPITI